VNPTSAAIVLLATLFGLAMTDAGRWDDAMEDRIRVAVHMFVAGIADPT
jgi:hypothetical protein